MPIQIAKTSWKRFQEHKMPLLAAGVAFFAFTSLFPGIIVAIAVYSLVADPATIRGHLESLADAAPESARALILDQIDTLTQTSTGALSIGLIIAVLVGFWSASGAINNLMSALNTAYGVRETRGIVRRRALALGFTAAMILSGLVLISLIAVTPAILDALDVPASLRVLVEAVRWLVTLLAMFVALGTIYRFVPDRRSPRMRWVSVGAGLAAAAWFVASLAFSFYVTTFGSYAKTYGTLAGVVVLLLWLWITFCIILFGAVVNAEAERRAPAPAAGAARG
jgi:membrane protein